MNISIIIPCYNSAQYINECIHSILCQDYDKELYEIIVIFDSCTDNSREIVEECLKNFPNRKLLSVNCRRPGLARNTGLNIAVGKYVWFIDSDDYLTDNSAFAQLTRIINASRRKAIYMTSFESERHINDRFAIWRYFYNREFLGTERFTDVPIDEDWEFTRRIMRRSGYSEIRLEEVLKDNFYELNAREIENLITCEVLKNILIEQNPDKNEIITERFARKKSISKDKIGNFIDNVLNESGKHSAKSGTVKNKLNFCKAAIEKINDFDMLSDEAKHLTERIYNFIESNNR